MPAIGAQSCTLPGADHGFRVKHPETAPRTHPFGAEVPWRRSRGDQTYGAGVFESIERR